MVGPNSDIVGFDPRGFGLSEPSICLCASPSECFQEAIGPTSYGQVRRGTYYRLKGVGEDCKVAVGGPTDAGPHTSTATIARDMMLIVDAYSQTTDGKAAPDEGKLLNFFGWSYATYFGQSIASIFPDRIGGMVLDGKLDPYSCQANSLPTLSTISTASLPGSSCTARRQDPSCVPSTPAPDPWTSGTGLSSAPATREQLRQR